MRALALVGLLLASCYDPHEVDCTVTCATANDCGDGQVCGSDGFCASPSVAGQCGSADINAARWLKITIDGPGKVTIDGVGNCDSDMAQNGACTFSVRAGTVLTLVAAASGNHDFSEWSESCHGGDDSCTLTPVMALTQVVATFD